MTMNTHISKTSNEDLNFQRALEASPVGMNVINSDTAKIVADTISKILQDGRSEALQSSYNAKRSTYPRLPGYTMLVRNWVLAPTGLNIKSRLCRRFNVDGKIILKAYLVTEDIYAKLLFLWLDYVRINMKQPSKDVFIDLVMSRFFITRGIIELWRKDFRPTINIQQALLSRPPFTDMTNYPKQIPPSVAFRPYSQVTHASVPAPVPNRQYSYPVTEKMQHLAASVSNMSLKTKAPSGNHKESLSEVSAVGKTQTAVMVQKEKPLLMKDLIVEIEKASGIVDSSGNMMERIGRIKSTIGLETKPGLLISQVQEIATALGVKTTTFSTTRGA